MLRIPEDLEDATRWAQEIADECMATADERGMMYSRAAAYYYQGTADARGCIHNKTKTYIDRLSGYLYLPSSVRFNILYGAHEPQDVLERGMAASQILSAEYRAHDSDLRFGDAVKWGLISGCYLLKHLDVGYSFRAVPVHPVNFGVLSETMVSLDDQEAFCHVTYPTVSRLRSNLEEAGRKDVDSLIARILERPSPERDQLENSYFHQMV